MKSHILKWSCLVAVCAATLSVAQADTAPGNGAVSGASSNVRLNNASPIPNGKEVVDQFRDAYAKQQKPRILLFVNRELLPSARLEANGRTETVTQVKGDAVDGGNGTSNIQIGNNTQTSGGGGIVINPRQTGAGGEKKETTTTYKPGDKANLGTPNLSEFDARQLEESFRAPYFSAGTRFIDQKMAASLLRHFPVIGERFLTPPTTDAEKEAQAALKQSADIAIELLGRHYDVSYPTPAGDTTIHRLDLVATAYDLKNPGVILGQISSESLYGFNQPGGTRRNVSDREIIDQTALTLMQQLTGTISSK
ncbi:MAG: hypothetical protein B9S32_12685 [Verrucomicrobia bacterium Tous-C9LFEB]|nr:MAG: hypothetical protein B9S32_12685 [Verrucomicrobia bacterium Tous-C9LFEB]